MAEMTPNRLNAMRMRAKGMDGIEYGDALDLLALVDELAGALEELHAMVWGECPSLLDEDSGGCGRLDSEIDALLARLKGGA